MRPLPRCSVGALSPFLRPPSLSAFSCFNENLGVSGRRERGRRTLVTFPSEHFKKYGRRARPVSVSIAGEIQGEGGGGEMQTDLAVSLAKGMQGPGTEDPNAWGGRESLIAALSSDFFDRLEDIRHQGKQHRPGTLFGKALTKFKKTHYIQILRALLGHDFAGWEEGLKRWRAHGLPYDEVTYTLKLQGSILSHRHATENAYLVLEEMKQAGMHPVVVRMNEGFLESHTELLALLVDPPRHELVGALRPLVFAAVRVMRRRRQWIAERLRQMSPKEAIDFVSSKEGLNALFEEHHAMFVLPPLPSVHPPDMPPHMLADSFSSSMDEGEEEEEFLFEDEGGKGECGSLPVSLDASLGRVEGEENRTAVDVRTEREQGRLRVRSVLGLPEESVPTPAAKPSVSSFSHLSSGDNSSSGMQLEEAEFGKLQQEAVVRLGSFVDQSAPVDVPVGMHPREQGRGSDRERTGGMGDSREASSGEGVDGRGFSSSSFGDRESQGGGEKGRESGRQREVGQDGPPRFHLQQSDREREREKFQLRSSSREARQTSSERTEKRRETRSERYRRRQEEKKTLWHLEGKKIGTPDSTAFPFSSHTEETGDNPEGRGAVRDSTRVSGGPTHANAMGSSDDQPIPSFASLFGHLGRRCS
uniref:Uncharacterized protein n=1 Tax=Chromera velia CCMP2878 TaxID=1169474 RepID=A0A0G4F3N1_9ALVE|eukprot:Cvel_14846.t1-p1 / transcript=Cvel_14846.t1 / gene=Cvel_14846 / organism=Chromera_velia_CCMP2878 / gene_product=hypothetical protein / transcript_product=hypothetical protein / location=Cvel_scaffold1072:44361-47429(+) / protein_length=643 / sequence_SO=supercontig / SO=protein_coding / is_pseudo=false